MKCIDRGMGCDINPADISTALKTFTGLHLIDDRSAFAIRAEPFCGVEIGP